MRIRWPVSFALALALLAGGWGAGAQPTATVVARHTLPDLRIAAVQNAGLPGSVDNDRGMLLGGIGSDLWRALSDPADEFYMVTDRGPNGQIRVGNANRRTFPIPGFDPMILKVHAAGGTITILQTIPILGQSGRPVTGLSNTPERDETPYDWAAQGTFPFNPSGLDTEGLVRTSAGDFWLVEEYGPAILHVDAGGRVLKRFQPAGVSLPGADYPVAETLPAIYGKRKGNRGFEALALSGDERTLYAVLQSPLLNPDRKTGDESRQTRILAFDIATERTVAEYVYRFDPIGQFDPALRLGPDEMKLSSAVWLNPTTLLINERTDNVAKLYRVDLAAATNILGSRWSDPATTPTLESLDDPAAAGVTVLPKRLVVDLSTLPGMPGKIEGVAVVDDVTVAVANDNDFDIGDFDAAGNAIPSGAKSHLLLIRLAEPLPLAFPRGK